MGLAPFVPKVIKPEKIKKVEEYKIKPYKGETWDELGWDSSLTPTFYKVKVKFPGGGETYIPLVDLK